MALLGVCLPFPSLSLAFCSSRRQGTVESKKQKSQPTEKSAALSFFFFVLLGIPTVDVC